jgi:uncharacterized membrane protein
MRSVSKILRNNIVVGLVLVAPLVITGFIVHFLIRLVANNWLTTTLTEVIFGILPPVLRDGTAKFVLSQIIAVLLVLAALFLIGFFVRSYFGRRLYSLAERILGRIPVFNKIYLQIRYISETIFAQRETMFNEVVLVEYPRKGVRSVGFVTSKVPNHFRTHFPATVPEDDALIAVFVPTTPNPTSGVMIFAPRSELTHLPVSIPEAMQLVISAGAVYPGEGPVDERPTLLDKLEAWITRETKIEPPTMPPGPPPANPPPADET